MLSHELKFQIDQLKRKIDEFQRRSEDRLDFLREEKQFWENIKSNSTDDEVIAQFKQLESSYARYLSNIELDNNKEISNYNYHIDELKNDISNEEAKNAKIVTENIDLGTHIDQLKGEYETLRNYYIPIRPKFEKLLSKVIQAKIQSHTSIIKGIDKINNSLDSIDQKIKQKSDSVKHLTQSAFENQRKINQAQEIILKLEKSLLDIGNLPEFTAPDPIDLIDSPDTLIKFVDSVEHAVRMRSNERDKKLSSTNRSAAQTMSESRRPPLSKDVAKLICQVGQKVIDLSHEYSSDIY